MLGLGLPLAISPTSSGVPSTNPSLAFRLNNIGKKIRGNGSMTNGRTSVSHVLEYDGSVTPCLANEIRFKRGRRVDHSDLIRYNAGVDGIEYFNTESDGSTLINPPPAMLHEGERENLFWYSEELDRVNWGKTGLDTVVNNEVIPTTTDEKNFLNRDTAVTSGLVYTQTHYVRPNGYSYVQLTGSTGFDSAVIVNFELTGNGSIVHNPTSAIADIEKLATGIYRLRLTTTSVSTTGGRILISVLPSNITSRLPDVIGNGSGVFFDHNQFEQASEPSSYIVTTSGPETRTADTIQNDSIANWDNAQGIAFLEFTALYASSTSAYGLFNTADAVAGVFADSATAGTVQSSDGTNTVSRNLTSWAVGDTLKLALVFDSVAGSMEIASTKNGGAWSAWTAATYDDIFTLETDLRWMFENDEAVEIIDTRIYKTLKDGTIAASKTWVEANL